MSIEKPSPDVQKKKLSKGRRLARLVLSFLDPRAWAHTVKLVNYANYTHVQPLRAVTRGQAVSISPTASFSNGRNITIGSHVSIGAHASLWAGNGSARIVVGDHVLIAPSVMISAANYRFNAPGPITGVPMEEADILIGSDVWIGYGAVILAGTRIGDGAIVGAGAIVRGEVPPRAIVANATARVIGHRQGEVVAGAPDGTPETALAGVPDPQILALIAAETGRDVAALALPLETCGIDSFDLITLRTALETGLDISIRDRDWAAIGSLADIARLPSLQGGSAAAAAQRLPARPSGAPASAMSAQPTPASSAPLAAAPMPAVPGQAERAYVLNMPQMALSGLSEAWLFKELGDLHWQLITEFLKTPSAAIADEEGARLYATFTRIRIEVEPDLRAFRENDPMRLSAHLRRYGAGMYFGEHALTGPGAAVRARTMSTFAKYGERGKNTSLIKGTPVIPDPEAVPADLQIPDFGQEYRERRASETDAVLFECDYDILSPHDINGVGLLYFAAYPIIADLCIERHEGPGFLMRHSTVMKDVLYFANAEPTERLRFRLHGREAMADGSLRFTASIARSSDGMRMAEVVSVKTPSVPPLSN